MKLKMQYTPLEGTGHMLFCSKLEYGTEPAILTSRNRFRVSQHLVIVDNLIDDQLMAFSLNRLQPEYNESFMGIATKWFYENSCRYPLSFELTKLGLGDLCTTLLLTFNAHEVKLIGKLFEYPIHDKPKIKKRKVDHAPESNAITFRKS